MVKNLPAVQEIWVHSLGQEEPLEEEMATHSSIHAWRIPWSEEPGGVQSKDTPEHTRILRALQMTSTPSGSEKALDS